MTPSTILVSFEDSNKIVEAKYDGTFLGTFANVPSPKGLLALPHLNPPQVAVCSEDNVIFFGVSDREEVGRIEGVYQAHDLAQIDETTILISYKAGGSCYYAGISALMVACIHQTNCEKDGDTKCLSNHPESFVSDDDDFVANPRITMAPAGTFFYFMVNSELYQCAVNVLLTYAGMGGSFSAMCGSAFLTPPNDEPWNPTSFLADSEQPLLLVGDTENLKIHVFDPSHGTHIYSVLTPSPLNSLAFKPGIYAPLTEIGPSSATVATETITLPVIFFDRVGNPIPSSNYDAAYEVANLNATAHSTVSLPGMGAAEIAVHGDLHLNSNSSSSATLALDLSRAGSWTVSVFEDLRLFTEPVGGEIELAVLAGPTDAASSEVEYNTTLVAGDGIIFKVLTSDVYGNPTIHDEHEFQLKVENDLTKAVSYQYLFSVVEKLTGDLVGGMKFGVQVVPAEPDIKSCRHSLEGITTFDPSKGVKLNLQAFLFDEFNNSVVDSTDFIVVIDGNLSNMVELEPPLYRHELAFTEDETREIKIGFLRCDAQGCDAQGLEHLPGSPKMIRMGLEAQDPAKRLTGAIVGTLTLASAVFIFVYWRQRKQAKKKEQALRGEQEQQRVSFVAKDELKEKEIENLQESLRKKKHSEDELAVMKLAMEELEKKRKDELGEVLISSSEVKVERLLGKGGFGIVNLATYRRQKVAMKQLLTINDDSVKRFR